MTGNAIEGVLVLQHIACEPPGVYEDVLQSRRIDIHRVEIDEGQAIPDWRSFGGIVVMGGPMSVNDDVSLPWLKEEKAFIRDAVTNGLPVWGVCLGSQLLAASLGGRVYKGPVPEVGVSPVTLTDAARSDRVFCRLPASVPTLHWHNDTFDLPPGSVLLASSAVYPNQAFRWGACAYGLQFHLEVTPVLARAWAEVPAYASDLERILGLDGPSRLLEDLADSGPAMNNYACEMFERWLDGGPEDA